MMPDLIRRWSLRVMLAFCAVVALCVLYEAGWRTTGGSGRFSGFTLRVFEIAVMGAAGAVAIHRRVPDWIEARIDDENPFSAGYEQTRFSWLRFGLEALLPICAVLGLLVPLSLLSLVLRHGKPLTGEDFAVVDLGVPWAAITAVDAFLRYRRSTRSASTRVWDRAASVIAPLAMLLLIALFFGPSQQLPDLPGKHPTITLLLTLPLVFDAGYALLRTDEEPKETTDRAHPSRSTPRRDHA